MPNIASVLKSEISRLAAREARKQIKGVAHRSASHRKDIAQLKRLVTQLKRKVFVLEKVAAKTPIAPSTATNTKVRFSAKGLKKQRLKSGLSAKQYAKLLGVYHLSVYNWEQGKNKPKPGMIAKIAALRGMTKKVALARLGKR